MNTGNILRINGTWQNAKACRKNQPSTASHSLVHYPITWDVALLDLSCFGCSFTIAKVSMHSNGIKNLFGFCFGAVFNFNRLNLNNRMMCIWFRNLICITTCSRLVSILLSCLQCCFSVQTWFQLWFGRSLPFFHTPSTRLWLFLDWLNLFAASNKVAWMPCV